MKTSADFHFRVWGTYCLKNGQGQYAIYKMKDNTIVEKGVEGLSWHFSQYELAEAFCNKLNEQLNEKVGK
jgi:hypothetical protein